MVAFNPETLCREAETHYLNFIMEGDSDIVPRHIIDHIIGCRHCHSRIEQLSNILAQKGSSPATSQSNAAVIAMLKLHFAYLNRQVTCRTVKPFLPTLIDPTLEIRIPTPITVHLDHCEECSQDLEKIRTLALSRGQLCRLSQMFADKLKDKYIACPKAQNAVNLVVNLSLHETEADILKHLCLCSFCRELVFEARKFAIKLLPENKQGNENPLCGQISPGDIFDYALPYGLEPSNDQYAKFRESLVSHIRKCPTCLGKIQGLHQILFGIIDRPDSGVVTICHTSESAKAKTLAAKHFDDLSAATDLYSGFPINVEVRGTNNVTAKKPSASRIERATQARSFTFKRLSPLVRFGGIAAVLAIAALLFIFTMPSAKAVTLEQIYEAVLRIKNVYITSFTSGQTEPTQKKWVSRSLGIYMTSVGDELTIWDINRGIRRTYIGLPDKTKQESLSSEETARIASIINSSLNVMPFENMSELPKDAKWQRLNDVEIGSDTSNLEVYGLLWSDQNQLNILVIRKWQVFVDPETKLPRRTEFYQMLPGEQEYTLKSFKVVDYPTDGEMRAIIKQISF
jgi:hypothetical protein